jgi:hypothetical protein
MATLNPTTTRVREATAEPVNRRIAREIENNVATCARSPELIDGRLRALDHEWDVERTLMTNAATLALTGTVLGIARDGRFLALPLVVTGFLLQHALQGWCPPLTVLRRLGVRTTEEINRERMALKALRGDFGNIGASGTSDPRERARVALRAATL